MNRRTLPILLGGAFAAGGFILTVHLTSSALEPSVARFTPPDEPVEPIGPDEGGAARHQGLEGKLGKRAEREKARKDAAHSGLLGVLKGDGEGTRAAGKAKGGVLAQDNTGDANSFSGIRGISLGNADGSGAPTDAYGGSATRGRGSGVGVGIGNLGTRGAGGGLGVIGAKGHARSVQLGDLLETGVPQGARFQGRERAVNRSTLTADDALSTFAVDVDTAAYSIARRSLLNGRMPEPSLVRVEEVLNYFTYDYDPPRGEDQLFSIQADGARSPVDASKYLMRVGIQAKKIADADRLPANLVFLVDTSCSMTSSDKLGLAKRALRTAVDHLTPKDRVAITTYAGGVRLVLPPTPASQVRRIDRAIRSLRSGGGTAMASGMKLAYRQAARMLRDDSVTRVIVLSDGDANIGATSHQEILKQIEGYVKEGVTLSTIGFGQGNYKDEMMEQLANRGNGNYYYVDSVRMARRVFGRDLTKMIQDVAQDVKIQVDFDPEVVVAYRLVGYENRDVADADFRNDRVDAGEIGAGHQVTALYELTLAEDAASTVATVRVRAKKPRGTTAKEVAFDVPFQVVKRPFGDAPDDLRFASAAMGAAELLRHSPYAESWSYARVLSILSDVRQDDPDRRELARLIGIAARLTRGRAVAAR